MNIAIVHDYLTQRGGAERVVLALARAFSGVPIYTSLYNHATTFADFARLDVRTLPLQAVTALRTHHRLAMPVLAPAFSRLTISADVVLCSSSGWAHGVRVEGGRKIVYCHSPAKWLYRPDDYLGVQPSRILRAALATMRPFLVQWDQRAAASADQYIANSTFIAQKVRDVYGRDAAVVTPPVTFEPCGCVETIEGIEPGFYLVVARLLAYKNVSSLVDAFRLLPSERLVVVGEGPLAAKIRAEAGPNVRLLGTCTDAQLRWLYRSCIGLVSASREDLGLTPLEAGLFGKPSAVLRWGGLLDVVVDGTTGIFFDSPSAQAIAESLQHLRDRPWDVEAIQNHAHTFSEAGFAARMRSVVSARPAPLLPLP